MEKNNTLSRPLLLALFVLALLIIQLIANVRLFGADASYGPNQISLFISGFVVMALGKFFLQVDFESNYNKILSSVQQAAGACFILLMVGPLISLWILGGIVPSFIYYGLELINPSLLLPIASFVCAIVALFIGSSWSTMGTLGVAFVGMGTLLGIHPGLIAGAVISGAYFGDKLSPLSDTTNLAAAIGETPLFTHIRYMSITTLPAFFISLLLFLMINLFGSFGAEVSSEEIAQLQAQLREIFFIHPVILLSPLLVIVLVAKKFPPLAALFVGQVLGVLSFFIFQQQLLDHFIERGLYEIILSTSFAGMELPALSDNLNTLLNRGGMGSMLTTVWLILSAMFFGGVFQATGMLTALAQLILRMVFGTFSLGLATILTCLGVNLTASDQYLAIILPGEMFKEAYEKIKLAPENLSRALEDGATLTSVLIPWNTCGAFAGAVLGISPLIYAPFCFFNLLCPVISLFYLKKGIKVKHL